MKRTKRAICAFVTCAVMVALTGCGDSKQITEVKALPFADSNMTVDNALDTRKMCDSVKWSTSQDDRNQTVVEYDCNYKGVDDSAFLQGESPKAVSAGDVWQWTYGADGTPSLTGVSMVVRHDDGSVHEVISGAGAGMVLSKLISNNTVEDYDHAFSIIAGRGIPLKYQEPSSPIPDSTHGNKLAPFYQGLSSGDAAAFAYRWKKVNVETVGTDSLGYLQLKVDITNPVDLYPVDPADVQLQFPLFQGNAEHPSEPLNYQPRDLVRNKLYCMGDYCFDYDDNLVGRTPSEVLAKESGYVTDGSGKVMPVAQPQQAAQAPSQQAMQQAVQQDAATHAQGSGAKVTMSTYGNVVASFYPGKPPLDAIQDALTSIHSELSVTDIAPSGYPEYQVECEANGQCVGGTGTSMGAAADVAKEMFPVNPADVGQGGVTCGQYICNDGKGDVIGHAPAIAR